MLVELGILLPILHFAPTGFGAISMGAAVLKTGMGWALGHEDVRLCGATPSLAYGAP